MPSKRLQAKQCRRAGVGFRVLILGILVWACGGCVSTSSRDTSLQPAELTGKSRAWFSERWGEPRAKSKRFFGGETWVYFRIDGRNPSVPFFNRAPHECQIYLNFNQQGALEEAVWSGC